MNSSTKEPASKWSPSYLSLKNFICRTAVTASLSLLAMSCVSRSNHGFKQSLPPIAVSTVNSGVKEDSITALEPVEVQSDENKDKTKNEIAPLLAPAVLSVTKDALKWINKTAWQMVGNYADKFGATYSANESLANFQYKNASPLAFPFVFRRTVTFKDKAEADQVLGSGHLRGSKVSSKSYQVVVMEVPFVLVSSGGVEQYSWRFIATDSRILRNTQIPLLPTKMLYQARKAKALGVSSIDNFEVVITVQCRIAEHSASGAYTFLSDPVSTTISGEKLTQKQQKAKLEGDWMPTPNGRCYSIKCTVAESSKMKDLLKKASDSGKGAVDSAIDKISF